MNKEDILESLRELAVNDASRSETARLRDIFDGIEGALAAGVKTEIVLETLHKQGFTLALSGFRSAIQRIRKERKNKHKEKDQSITTQANTNKETTKDNKKTEKQEPNKMIIEEISDDEEFDLTTSAGRRAAQAAKFKKK
jgi:radical SAM superfamily enzyme YgiQ (UPF0313 family)